MMCPTICRDRGPAACRARHRLPAALLATALATALALAAPPARCQYTEPALGRLFTAPDERMRLDRDRDRARTLAAAPQAPVAEIAPPAMTGQAVQAPQAPLAPKRFAGVVRRSDGQATVWIDDEPQETTLPPYKAGSAVPVDMPGGRAMLKPGQSFDPNDGTIRDPR